MPPLLVGMESRRTRLAELEAEADTYWAKTMEEVERRMRWVTLPERTPNLGNALPSD